MRKEYEDELKKLKLRMLKAESFAERVPLFKDKILSEKITGEEDWFLFCNSYKNLNTHNGIKRGHFVSGTSRSMTNFHDEHDCYCWTIYINTLGEYGSHAKYGLKDIFKDVSVFYFDGLNSTFYCTDAEIENLLEALNEWVIKARESAQNDRIDSDIREAETELKIAQNKIDKLKKSHK